MSYVDQNMSKEKTVSAVITAIILAVVGYAFYTGLAFNIIKKAAKDLNVIDIQDQPPPPPKAPPPPPQQKEVTPPIVAPPPLVSPPVVSAPTIVTVPNPPPVIITPTAPPAPPPPPRPSQAVGAKPRGNPGDWVTSDDYPPSSLRNEEQGRTGFKLDVDATGKIANCTVTSSSGFPDLDATACKLLPRRGRFTPAKDASGAGMASTYSSTIVWRIPKD